MPRAFIVPIVRVLAELRFHTVTGTGADTNGAGRCAGKAIVVGVIDIPITFPSRMKVFAVPLTGPATDTVVTGVPETGTGETEFPIYMLPSGEVTRPVAVRRNGPTRPVSAPVKMPAPTPMSSVNLIPLPAATSAAVTVTVSTP